MKKSTRNALIVVVVLTAALIGVIFYKSVHKAEPVVLSDLDMTVPQTVEAVKALPGEFSGERNTTMDGKKQAEQLQDVDTEKFFIYSYNSSPAAKGKSTDLWIENRDINKYSVQTVILDTDSQEVIYISPILDPGTYVEEQRLITADIDTSKSYEVQSYLYLKDKETYTLYSIGTSSLTFSKK